MAPLALRLLWTGESMSLPTDEAGAHDRWVWLAPLTVPLVAGPAALVGALSYGTRFGEGTTIGAAALVAVTTAAVLATGPPIVRALGPWGVSALGRLSGALLAVILVELMLDGIQSV
jgi:small neutral amino acid transporter SnatA (MarC family)